MQFGMGSYQQKLPSSINGVPLGPFSGGGATLPEHNPVNYGHNLQNGLSLPLGPLATYQFLLLHQQHQNMTRNILSLPNLANQGLEYRYVH
jgi:hypothetical protein